MTQNEPCGSGEWQEARRLVKAVVARHAGPIEVLVPGERQAILRETEAEQEEVAHSLPFDAEAAFGKQRLERVFERGIDLGQFRPVARRSGTPWLALKLALRRRRRSHTSPRKASYPTPVESVDA